ncbi:predicted protein [Scheffersomyces stipitis CBS 6054]|uniref:Uncharacterized protein n=1 Tax=Scheffersomyces stipitis (strain ATCC 58785 / CBS 6054 / NBRC 10063 / NRRL Y-11545) TaxID=322104 RepID=A3GHX4_PICST|nr:predicted protein [Scheffersomyces stipitis CBS 6054]EAZ63130.2 predicted protein [Scheffersomyces stipitis CBS 6054]KAG2735079.1 hypothetical protein G9P44_001293 [Scheffersomyces stipitis]
MTPYSESGKLSEKYSPTKRIASTSVKLDSTSISLAPQRVLLQRETSPSNELKKVLDRPRSRGLSPVRRSGSPVRRNQISQLEHETARKRQLQLETQNQAKKPRVTFKDEVEIKELETVDSKSEEPSTIEETVYKLKLDVSEIRNDMAKVMDKITAMDSKVDKLLQLLEPHH